MAAPQLLEELRRQKLVQRASDLCQEVASASSGLIELDAITGGGVPRGGITEVVAPASGGAAVLYALLAAAASRGELCALVDPADGLDVASARAAGVSLEQLLWVRPQGVAEALRAAELILETGGFGVVALDLGMPGKSPARIPVAAWMRIRRQAAASGSVVLVVSTASDVGELASVSVKVRPRRARWRGRVPRERWLEGIELGFELCRRRWCG